MVLSRLLTDHKIIDRDVNARQRIKNLHKIFWNTSVTDEMPSGCLKNLYPPKGVAKQQIFDVSSSRGILWNPVLASRRVNIFAPDSSGSMWSRLGISFSSCSSAAKKVQPDEVEFNSAKAKLHVLRHIPSVFFYAHSRFSWFNVKFSANTAVISRLHNLWERHGVGEGITVLERGRRWRGGAEERRRVKLLPRNENWGVRHNTAS